MAAFLCRNAQVVIGAQMQPFHFIPLGIFFGCRMLFLVFSKWIAFKPWWDKRLAIVACSFLITLTLANEKSGAEAAYRMFGLPQNVESALAWVRNKTPQDSLFLSLSIDTNELLSLYTEATVLTPSSDPNFVGPFQMEKYFGNVAQMIKASHADPDKFLEAWCVLPSVRHSLGVRLSKEETYLQKVDFGEALEGAEWLHTYGYADGDKRDEPVLAARKRVKDLLGRVSSLSCPFYFWLNAKDQFLLKRFPTSFGGGGLPTRILPLKFISSPAADFRLFGGLSVRGFFETGTQTDGFCSESLAILR